MTLQELLKDWVEQDEAQYYLACCLGLMEYDKSLMPLVNNKHVFWTGNSIQKMLFEMFKKMIEVSMIEFNDDAALFRWNPAFKGYWEKD